MGVCDQEVVLIGGGGHAIVALAAAQRADIDVCGFLDDNKDAAIGSLTDAPPWLGGLHAISVLEGRRGHIAIGNLTIRRAILDQHQAHPINLVEFIDPSAIIVEPASLGPGGLVAAGAVVQAAATVGPHCIINTGAIVEHECEHDENVHVAPGAILGGRVRIGRDTLIGLGSRVLPGVTIGVGCVIGAGAVVTRDVSDGRRVVGIPAKS